MRIEGKIKVTPSIFCFKQFIFGGIIRYIRNDKEGGPNEEHWLGHMKE